MASSEASGPCRKCGKESLDACSGCKDALYCSKSCQKWDWKTGGHKTLCRGPVANKKIHVILRELFVAEYEWLESLTPSQKEDLIDEDHQNGPLNHLFIAGEVALVLARGTACAVLSNPRMHSEYFGDEYYEAVLAPWYVTHKAFLNEQGFVVEHYTHGVFLADRPCPCGVPFCRALTDHVAGAAIIKDTRNADIDLVNKVFTVERSPIVEQWSTEEKKLKYKDFLRCISYPVSAPSSDTGTGSLINYNFDYPGQVFGSAQVCCSPALCIRFRVDPRDAVALGKHFFQCRNAMKSIGFSIGMDMSHPEKWPDKALAQVFWQLSGCDIATMQRWFFDEGVEPVPFDTRDIESARMRRIVRLVFDLHSDGELDEQLTEEDVDDTGLEERDILLVMSQAECSRARAVMALQGNDGDLVSSIMDTLN